MMETLVGASLTFVLSLAAVVARLFYNHSNRISSIETHIAAQTKLEDERASDMKNALDRIERKVDHIVMRGAANAIQE